MEQRCQWYSPEMAANRQARFYRNQSAACQQLQPPAPPPRPTAATNELQPQVRHRHTMCPAESVAGQQAMLMREATCNSAYLGNSQARSAFYQRQMPAQPAKSLAPLRAMSVRDDQRDPPQPLASHRQHPFGCGPVPLATCAAHLSQCSVGSSSGSLLADGFQCTNNSSTSNNTTSCRQQMLSLETSYGIQSFEEPVSWPLADSEPISSGHQRPRLLTQPAPSSVRFHQNQAKRDIQRYLEARKPASGAECSSSLVVHQQTLSGDEFRLLRCQQQQHQQQCTATGGGGHADSLKLVGSDSELYSRYHRQTAPGRVILPTTRMPYYIHAAPNEQARPRQQQQQQQPDRSSPSAASQPKSSVQADLAIQSSTSRSDRLLVAAGRTKCTTPSKLSLAGGSAPTQLLQAK